MSVEQGRAVAVGSVFGRLAVELRIVALLGLLAQLALVQAWGWTILETVRARMNGDPLS